MAAPTQMLVQADGSADSLVESMCEVQTTMAQLHSSVGLLINSMAEILKSMAEMKAALEQTTTESRLAVEQQDLPAAPEKQSISAAVDSSVFEEKEESRYTYLKRIQVEMPVFEGLNVDLWIIKAERYFKIGKNFTEAEKLRLVYMSFDGRALNWFNLSDRLRPFADWEDFKSRLLDRFGHSESATRRLLALKQVKSVVDYLGQFEELASQLSADTPDFFFENVFVNGLKDEIQDMLPLFQPKGLKEIISLARRLENSRFFGRLMMNPPLDNSSSPAADLTTKIEETLCGS